MRIKFTEHVDVDLATVPKSALGAIGIRHAKRTPVFSTAGQQTLKDKEGKPVENSAGEAVKIPLGIAEMKTEGPAATHFFRKNWPAELPDDVAQKYIDAGQAVAVEQVHFVNAEMFALFDGMYSQADQDLLLAGVILGYAEGSKADKPIYLQGPNWDIWNAARLEVQP